MVKFDRHITREEALRMVGAGWSKLIHEAYNAFDKDPEIEVGQVKEKFGGLRIYIDHCSDHRHIGEVVARVENLSFTVCEQCGAPGVLRGDGWMKTLCDEHGAGRPPFVASWL